MRNLWGAACDKVHKPFVEVPKGTVAGGAYGCLCLHISSGWWFGTMELYDFPSIGTNNPNWRTHIFQRGGSSTNQIMWLALHLTSHGLIPSVPIHSVCDWKNSSLQEDGTFAHSPLPKKMPKSHIYHCLSIGFCHFPWELVYLHPDCMMMSSYILLYANMRHVWLLLGGKKGTRLNSISW